MDRLTVPFELIKQFEQRMGHKRVKFVNGPGGGRSTNFLSLTCAPGIDADFFSIFGSR